MQEKQKIFKEESSGKNATPEYTKVFSDEKIFEGVRPSILQEDSTAHGIEEDLQTASVAARFSDYKVQLKGNILHESFAPKIQFTDIQKYLFKIIKKKEFQKFKKKLPINIKDITNLNDYVRLKIDENNI